MMYDTPYHTVIVIKLSTLYPTRSALIIATTCPLALGYRSDPVSAAGKSPRSKAMPLNPLINGHQDAPTAFTTFLLPVGGKIHLILRNIFQSDFLQRWHGTDLPNRTINSFAVCKAIRDILGIWWVMGIGPWRTMEDHGGPTWLDIRRPGAGIEEGAAAASWAAVGTQRASDDRLGTCCSSRLNAMRMQCSSGKIGKQWETNLIDSHRNYLEHSGTIWK